MIRMPLEDIMQKIKEKSNLSETEINSKIDSKMKQLSGLISKEGAAHIIANEMGIKLFDQISGRLQVKNILAGMRDVETVGKVLQVFEVREFMREESIGKVGSFIIGDETGTIRAVCWGEKTAAINELKPGDIVKIVSGYIRENNGQREVHLNDRSKLILNPPGEKVGEVAESAQSSSQAVRKKINELREEDTNAELMGTIVQVFDPKFFEICPQCGSRAAPKDGKFFCKKHESVDPAYSYVFNVFLDDGTDNVRVVLFRQQAEKLTGKTPEEMLSYRDSPEKFEEVKNALLGNIIKVTGRVKKNEMFQRIDFVTRDVDPQPDPGKEIERLKNGNAVQ